MDYNKKRKIMKKLCQNRRPNIKLSSEHSEASPGGKCVLKFFRVAQNEKTI